MKMWQLMRRIAVGMAWRIRCLLAVRGARARSGGALRRGRCKRLLVVCYGNIFRSPYVAALLRKRLAGVCEVRSSGFHRVAGRPSPADLVEIAAGAGIDLSAHRSTQVTRDDLAWADTIVLMDRHNWQALRQLDADPLKLVWLGAMDGGDEIRDPYGLPKDEVRAVMTRVHGCTERLAAMLLAAGPSSR